MNANDEKRIETLHARKLLCFDNEKKFIGITAAGFMGSFFKHQLTNSTVQKTLNVILLQKEKASDWHKK